VVERADRAPVSTFYAPGAWGPVVELDEGAAHHASVKRLSVGDMVRLTSGDGRRVRATITTLAKKRLEVARAEEAEAVSEPCHVELWAPVGDRDRMLWLAEKVVELGVSSWRPVLYRRSRSVSPRGEGEGFREKVRLRMISALEQSGSAWLPRMHPEIAVEDALREESRPGVLLDAEGPWLASMAPSLSTPLAMALGPEGGLDPGERDAFLDAGWRAASLGANVLRFETAGIAALAVVRSLLR
jgi:16S rRNA (uracil1498-N3)-methyltransferase